MANTGSDIHEPWAEKPPETVCAKSIVALAFRNGPIEGVHAGKETVS